MPVLSGLHSTGSAMSESSAVYTETSEMAGKGKPGEARGSAVAPNRLFNLPIGLISCRFSAVWDSVS
jgi:hypothetical protein